MEHVKNQATGDQPSDWWTITSPSTGEEVARVYGPTAEDMAAVASKLSEVKVLIRRHGGFTAANTMRWFGPLGRVRVRS